MDIRKSGRSDVAAIARIHANSLPDDYLPSLGIEFLEKVYYPAKMKSPYAATLAAYEDGQIAGFVTVVTDANRFYREVIRSNLMTLVWYAFKAALKEPAHILKTLEIFKNSMGTHDDPVAGEIELIAVDERYRGRGLGKALVLAALQYLSEKGIRQCRTKTLASNLNVIGMYAKMGWSIRDRFRLIGREYVTIVSQ